MILNKVNLQRINNDCSYLNKKLYEKWLHIGSGNFHRSHQAYYLHQLLKKNLSNWTIINFEILKSKKVKKFNKDIEKQNSLYTLLSREKSKKKKNIIGSISKFLLNNEKSLSYIKKNINKNLLKLVTITITENGYYINNNNFEIKNRNIQYDLHNKDFKTIYGMLFFILENCINSNKKITIISCDNINDNSQSLKKAFKIFCKKKNNKYIKYINKYLIFCNCMVDRITPKYNVKAKKEINKNFKYVDNCHVESENFISWIIQQNNKVSLPPLKKVGVKFVKDISKYQEMKMQILNASHCSTSFLAALDNKKYVFESFNDKKFLNFINCYIKNDVIPNLKKNFYNYNLFLNSVIKRFGNNAVPDLVQRTTINGSKNLEIFICGSQKKNFNNKKELKRYALIFASWYVFISKNKYFEDDNYKYLKKHLRLYKKPITFIKRINKPTIKDIIDNNFENKFNLYVNMLKNNRIRKAINDTIK